MHIIKLEIIILYLLLYYYYIMKFILLYYYYIIIVIIIIIVILLVYHEIIILYNHLFFFINCISTRSAPQMLSLKDEYNLRCSNFLIIICVILLLIVDLTKYNHQKSFYQKI